MKLFGTNYGDTTGCMLPFVCMIAVPVVLFVYWVA